MKTINVKSKEEAIRNIIDLYFEEEVVMDELLDTISIEGLSVGDVFTVYTTVLTKANDDTFFQEKDGELVRV